MQTRYVLRADTGIFHIVEHEVVAHSTSESVDIDITLVADAIVPASEKFEIPTRAEKLLYYIVSRELRTAITGDLEEEAQRRALKWGYASARRWYWFQVVRVAYEQVKMFLTVGLVLGAWRAIRGLFSGG